MAEHEPAAGYEGDTVGEHQPGAVPDFDPDAAAEQADAGQAPPGDSRMARMWRAFSSWRRTRPFWAGVVLIISGLELLLIPLPVNSMGLILHIGTGGVLGILIGGLLIACALLFWFNPVHRIFYGIMAILLSVGALIASNLGGFLLGTLLGVVGGSLGFAWAPLPETPQEALVAPDGPDEGLDLLTEPPAGEDAEAGVPEAGVADSADAEATDAEGADASPEAVTAQAGGHGATHHGPGFYTALVLTPVLLAAVAIGVPAMARAASTRGSAPSIILPSIPIFGSGSSSPSPSPSPSPSSGGLLPSLGPSASPSPSASASGSAKPKKSQAPKATVDGSFEASATPSDITANQAVLTGLKFDGVATVQTASGSEQVLKFTMDELSLTGDDLTTQSASGRTVEFKASSFDFKGNVTLLTTSLSGTLLGIPLTFTPQDPPPITLTDMTLDNVDSKNVVTIADTFTIGGLQIISGGSGAPAGG